MLALYYLVDNTTAMSTEYKIEYLRRNVANPEDAFGRMFEVASNLFGNALFADPKKPFVNIAIPTHLHRTNSLPTEAMAKLAMTRPPSFDNTTPVFLKGIGFFVKDKSKLIAKIVDPNAVLHAENSWINDGLRPFGYRQPRPPLFFAQIGQIFLSGERKEHARRELSLHLPNSIDLTRCILESRAVRTDGPAT